VTQSRPRDALRGLYLADVTPGIAEAWIAAGVGGLGIVATAVVAVVNARNTRQTAIATIDTGRETRVWEKQSAAYEDAVKEVLARRTRRTALTSRGDIGNIGSHPVEEIFKAEDPEIIRVRARLRPYASDEVWAAYEAASARSRLSRCPNSDVSVQGWRGHG
jgi:hypothetical protein